jgi:hypothetical protein
MLQASTLSPRPPSKVPAGPAHPPHSGFFLTESGGHGVFESPRGDNSTVASSSDRRPRAAYGASAALSFSQAAPGSGARQWKSTDYEYERPDMAPFSTMINQMITGSVLFKSKQDTDWADIASVGADYAAQFKQKKKKSPAYRALEQLSGLTEADVVRSQLTSHKEGVNTKLKSFGHSIVSL